MAKGAKNVVKPAFFNKEAYAEDLRNRGYSPAQVDEMVANLPQDETAKQKMLADKASAMQEYQSRSTKLRERAKQQPQKEYKKDIVKLVSFRGTVREFRIANQRNETRVIDKGGKKVMVTSQPVERIINIYVPDTDGAIREYEDKPYRVSKDLIRRGKPSESYWPEKTRWYKHEQTVASIGTRDKGEKTYEGDARGNPIRAKKPAKSTPAPVSTLRTRKSHTRGRVTRKRARK